MIRLNELLSKCSSSKYRKGYIKYLAALDYKEFEKVFTHYFEIISMLLIKYDFNYKIFSKNWFKNKFVNRKYEKLYDIFMDANSTFVAVVVENIRKKDILRDKLIQEISDLKESVARIYSTELLINVPPTSEDIIQLRVLLTNSIYAELELKRLMDELQKLKYE